MRETKLWTWHIITAAIILVLLGMHMFIMHLDLIIGYMNPEGGRAIEWANVLARMKMTAFTVTYVILLGAALYHGLYGLRTILFELNPAKMLQTLITVVFTLTGLVLFVIGTYAAIASKLFADKV